jgi:hypothetical protein
MRNLQRFLCFMLENLWLGLKDELTSHPTIQNIEIEIHLQFSFQVLAVRLPLIKTRFLLYRVFELNCMSLIKHLLFAFCLLVVTWH